MVDSEELVKKHPILYKQRYMSMRETCMCWGFECGPGWGKILAELSEDIDEALGYNKWYRKLWYLKVVPAYNATVRKFNTLQFKLPAKLQRKTAFGSIPYFYLNELFGGFQATQVKEKYGTLRFYTNYSTRIMDKLINHAEYQSEKTCELCGEEGELSGYGWLTTLCETHRKEKGVPTYKEAIEEIAEKEKNEANKVSQSDS